MFQRLFSRPKKRRTHMEKRTFESGRSAMGWLTGAGGDPPSAKVEREIAQVLTKGKRSGRTSSPRRPSAPKSSPRRGNMTLSEFMKSLPPNLNLSGDEPGPRASSADALKQIRADLPAAVRAGVLPDGTQFSVTTDHNSIRIRITRWGGQVFTNKYQEHLMDPTVKLDNDRYDRDNDSRLTPELNRALRDIEKIANRHNYNKSDSMTDYFNVGYYLHVSASPVMDAAETGIKLESNKELASKMEDARKAAKALGPAATKSICGNKDLDKAGTECLDRLIKIAKRADGKPVEYDASRRGWYPVAEKSASAHYIKLGKTSYSIAYKNPDESSYTLLGPRGGSSSLVRSSNQPDSWGHVDSGSGRSTPTWYHRNANGTFTKR